MDTIQTVIENFDFEGELIKCESFGKGHINDTYRLTYTKGVYILQRINTDIFKKPVELMENIVRVTDFLREKIKRLGGDPRRETMHVIPTKDKKNLYQKGKEAWRAYDYIEDTESYDLVESKEDFYNSGVAFGRFQKLLEDFPIDTLNTTIEDFHNTPVRFKTFESAVEDDIVGRAASCKEDIDFILQEKDFVNTLWDYYEKGELKLKVTHNDTKLNNVLMDKNTKEVVSVVDLDTVMPGFALDDFGDSIRFGASTAVEDEKDLDKVNFDIDLFEVYIQGFLSGAEGSLTDLEISLFPVAAKMITLEQAIRFLTDYLQGDTYFKTAYDDHNLVRTRTQLKLVDDMNSLWAEMNDIVKKYI